MVMVSPGVGPGAFYYFWFMARPKKLQRFTRISLSKNYWVAYEHGIQIGHVTVGSGSNYYFTNPSGIVVGENFTSMKQALNGLISSVCANASTNRSPSTARQLNTDKGSA
jgi:arabinogalactan endo-1,4-beta-galactosidase